MSFRLIVWIRSFLYESNIFLKGKIKHSGNRSWNLTMGGTGKTPVVERLAKELRGRRKVAGLVVDTKAKKMKERFKKLFQERILRKVLKSCKRWGKGAFGF